jgi:cation diffusion facilitator family transporter
LLILLAGFEIARKMMSAAPNPPRITPWIIGGLGASVLAPLLFGYYTIRVGKRTGSPTLSAEGRHRQADVLSLIVVLIALASDYFGLNTGSPVITIDRIAAALVLVFIGYAGWELLANGMRVLLDASIDPETLIHVEKIIESEPAVTQIHSLAGRNAGRYRFLEADIVLRTSDLEKAHAVSQRLETAIRDKVSNVDRVLIHYEPMRKETIVVAVPIEMDRVTLSEHFGEAPFYYVAAIRESDGQILEESYLANPFLEEEKAKGIKVSKWLLQKGMDRLFTPKDLTGKGAGYVLSDAGVEVLPFQEKTLGELRLH